MGGDGIERVLVIESSEKRFSVIDEMLEKLKEQPGFELLCLNQETVPTLPGLKVDLAHRKVICGGQEVNLTAKEYDLFCLLMANIGQILTYDQIYQKVWKEEAFGNANNAIKCHIRNLREKLYGSNPDVPFSIRCVREVGYCLEVDPEEIVDT